MSNITLLFQAAIVNIADSPLGASLARAVTLLICSPACLLKVYPGWQMWIYHDATAPDRVLTAMRALPHVRTVDMSRSGIANQMSWKFLIASDATVER